MLWELLPYEKVMCVYIVMLDIDSTTQVSNGLPACIGVLDYNLIVNIERTIRGGGFPKWLQSK